MPSIKWRVFWSVFAILIICTFLVLVYVSSTSKLADDIASTQTFAYLFDPSAVPPSTLSAPLYSTLRAFASKPMQPYPRFLSNVQPLPNSVNNNADKIVIRVWYAGLWEPGDTWNDVENRLLDHTVITIDGLSIPYKPNNLMELSLVGYTLPLTETTVAPQGPDGILVVPAMLEAGYHIITVEVGAKGKIPHSFTWSFYTTAK